MNQIENTQAQHQVKKADSDLYEDALSHLQHADPAILTVCLAQMTDDMSVLERYGSKLSVNKPPFLPIAQVELPKQLHSSLVNKVAEAIRSSKGKIRRAFLDIDEDTVARMADIAAAGPVPPEYMPMLIEQSGLAPDRLVNARERAPDANHEIAIIGAGMTGLATAVMARNRGYSYTIFDSSSDAGGVWCLNDYPGVAVDTPSTYYSLSYKLNPHWSNYYPKGNEYLAYLQDVAKAYDVYPHIRLRHTAISIEWMDESKQWSIQFRRDDGSTFTHYANSVITAMGHLNRPKYPKVPGLDTFKGASFHANRWDWSQNLEGKRVGVLGVGATGVQVVGSISDQVEHMTVFQRQPHWVMPNLAGSGDVDPHRRWALENVPNYIHWDRFRQFWLWGDNYGYAAFRVDSEWASQHVSISKQNNAMMQFCVDYINRCFDGPDSEMARKVTPGFAPGGKRPVRDPGDFAPGGYYYALSQDHVDLETQEVVRVVPEGIELSNGRKVNLDVIIYATGLTTDFLSTIDVTGRQGHKLEDIWDGRPHTYLGGTFPGFPNLYINCGPNTGVGHAGGHNFMAETVNHFAFECLQLLTNSSADSIEINSDAEEEFDELTRKTMEGSIWRHQLTAHTYYRNNSNDVIFPTPFRHVDYWRMSRAADPNKFTLGYRKESGAVKDCNGEGGKSKLALH